MCAVALIIVSIIGCKTRKKPRTNENGTASHEVDQRPLPLFPTRDVVEQAFDEGDSLLIAVAGEIMRIPKDGSQPETVVRVGNRTVRAMAPTATHLVVLSYPRGDYGELSIKPPGTVSAFSVEDSTSVTLAANVNIMARVSVYQGTPYILDEATKLQPRLRWFDPVTLRQAGELLLPDKGTPAELLADERGLVVGIHDMLTLKLFALTTKGEREKHLYSSEGIAEVGLSSAALITLHSKAIPASTDRGERYFEHPGSLQRINRASGVVEPVHSRVFTNGRQLAVGPTHACLLEYFPGRPSSRNRDFFVVPLDGGNPVAVLKGQGGGRCLSVDSGAAYIVTDRGLERFPIHRVE
jgi:hypothetical protein